MLPIHLCYVDFRSALMHMHKVRSENGYGFLKSGLKTGVGNGIFFLKLGLDLEMRAAHPHQKFQGVPPPGFFLRWREDLR